jgi:hemoglobin-like flavoprotein
MTPGQIDLVRKTFDSIWPVRRKLADLFYRRFFELAPDARHLFFGDMERRQLKLMDMIATIVGTLDKGEIFRSIISHSGRQHALFGAQLSHFAAFGDALIWGLEQQFGAAFTPEMKEPWIKLYDAVQREMIRAGGQQRAEGGAAGQRPP